MKFRLKKKLNLLACSRNDRAFTRLFVVMLVLTFFLAAYLYGLVEISSRQLVIKISTLDADETKLNKIEYEEKMKPSQNSAKKKLNNITEMFLRVERFNLMIKSLISQNDIEMIQKLKAQHTMANEKKTIEATDTTKKDEGENEKISEKTINDNVTVSRDVLIKFLKYEKYVLKKKRADKSIQTVSNLVADYIAKNEIEIE